MVFPKMNLSAGSTPWGREVQKRIELTDSQLASLAINDRSDTKRLQDSYRRLDETVQGLLEADVAIQGAVDDAAAAAADAQAAIDGITSLGSIDSPYTINAGNINAGTLTGVTIQSGTSGTRVVMNAENLSFYNTNGYVGKLNGGTLFANEELSLNNYNNTTNVYVDATTSNLRAYNGTIGASFGVSHAGSGGASIFTSGAVSIFTGALSWDFNGLVAGRTTTSGGLDISGTVTTGSSLSVGTSLTVSSGATISGSVTVGGNLSTDGSLTRTALAGGGSTTATINNAGQFVRTTSSARYKQDIESINVPLSTVLQMEPRKFRLIEEVEESADARYYGGFIAEELDALGLDTFVGYEKLEDGTVRPESVYYAELTAALVSAIKELNTRIETLEGK